MCYSCRPGYCCKGIAKSSVPFVQKAGIIMAVGAIAGVIYTIASTINSNTQPNTSCNKTSNILSCYGFMDFGYTSSSIEILSQCTDILSSLCIFFTNYIIITDNLQSFYTG